MIKVIMPMRRREGMTIDEFREYYETKHRIIGEKYLTGYATKYIRRFTNPLPDRSGKTYDPDFDVLMEIWYPDMETFEKCAENLQKPEIKKEINVSSLVSLSKNSNLSVLIFLFHLNFFF